MLKEKSKTKRSNKVHLKKKTWFSDLKIKDFEYSDPEDILKLLNDVIRFLNKTDDFNKALSYAINKICIYSSWDLGHCFIISNDRLVSSKIWNNNADIKYDRIKKSAEKSDYKSGEGIPGLCFESKKPFWIVFEEILIENHFLQIKLAKKLGLNTGVWIPVLCNENVIAVMEFFSVLKKPPGKQIINAVVNIAGELGNLAEKNMVMEKIKSREKLLKETQRITNVGSWEKNLKTGEIYLSDELHNILGFDNNDGFFLNAEIKKIIHPDDAGYVESTLKEFLNDPYPFNLKFRIVTKDAGIKYLYAVTRVDKDSEGMPLRTYGSVQDITNIKQYEDELYNTNKKLLETQRELIHSEKLAALGRFSAGIAHEIRNPLANISALSQLIIKQSTHMKNQKHLRMILDNTDIANKIIKDLLNYASPEEPELKEENFGEILNEVVENIRVRCDKYKIKLSVKTESGLPVLNADKLRIKTAMMNFISNSIDAMPGGGELTIRSCIEKKSNFLKIVIADSGIGIHPDNLDKIFEPFFTTKHNGTGLGLGLAYQVIKSHNGEVNIRSKPKSGTAVEILLPLNKSKNET
jgi:signal transduction histidine kinase